MKMTVLFILISIVLVSGCVKQVEEDIDRVIVTSTKAISLTDRLASGDMTAIPEAIALLESDELITDMEPPILSRQFIFYALQDYTGLSFGFDPFAPEMEREVAINNWEQWWEDNKDKLVWNGEKFVVE